MCDAIRCFYVNFVMCLRGLPQAELPLLFLKAYSFDWWLQMRCFSSAMSCCPASDPWTSRLRGKLTTFLRRLWHTVVKGYCFPYCACPFGAQWFAKYWFYIHVTMHRNRFLCNKQPDAPIIQIYSVIKLYMFRASSVPIIRSSVPYIRRWLSFMQVFWWPLPSRVRVEP